MKQKQLLHQEKATAMLMHFNSCNFASKICDVDIKKINKGEKSSHSSHSKDEKLLQSYRHFLLRVNK